MTRSIRKSGNSTKIVCISYCKKYLFTPENILLGAVILGIGALAEKFKAIEDIEWDPEGIDSFRMYNYLDDVISIFHISCKRTGLFQS